MKMQPRERAIEIKSGELTLEASLHEGSGVLSAVVLHPHPMYGGDMDNHVVLAACQALSGAGATTLRFNFRGAGHSGGSFDGKGGESDDARAAVGRLRELAPGTPLLLAGYSFGAAIAADVAGEMAPTAIVLVSPPAGMMKIASLDARTPALLISGEHDQIAPPDALRALETPRHRVVGVPGADHGWWPGLDTLVAELTAFISALEVTKVSS
jgi:alpha/beta superfamily hydrolase